MPVLKFTDDCYDGHVLSYKELKSRAEEQTARANEKCPSGILLKEGVPGKIGPLVSLGFYLQL